MHNRDVPHTNNADGTSKWDALAAAIEQAELKSRQNETVEQNSEDISELEGLNPELFSFDKQRAVMNSIVAPTDAPNGMAKVMDSLRAKHELRILADMGGAGFENWASADENNLRQFVRKFPSPADFEDASNEFLDSIGKYNGPQKLAQYQQAMASFKHKVYGEKQTYWEQMQAVNDLLGETDLMPRSTEQPFVDVSSITEPRPGDYQEERSAEWISDASGVLQVSRAQVQQGLTGNQLYSGEADRTCQDTYIIRPDESFFGVFDGAGGEFGGREASHAAAESINQACDKYNLKSGADLAYILNAANQPVREATNNRGYTTATLAKVIERNGHKMLAYASVGDSRLYVVRQDGSAELITHDEGEGNRITNALGVAGDERTRQYGEISVNTGDKIILCTDGITGDYGDDLMDNEELGDIVQRSHTPDEAAINLVEAARKVDDRTAVVFSI